MDGCFKQLIKQVQKYEGTVDKLLGDGMMALFGAPVSREDHAQLACLTALGMQQVVQLYAEILQKQYGIDFKLRYRSNKANHRGEAVVARNRASVESGDINDK